MYTVVLKENVYMHRAQIVTDQLLHTAGLEAHVQILENLELEELKVTHRRAKRKHTQTIELITRETRRCTPKC